MRGRVVVDVVDVDVLLLLLLLLLEDIIDEERL